MDASVARIPTHFAWANHRCLESISTRPAARDRGLALLGHVIGAEEIWLARVGDRESALPEWPVLDADRLSEWIDRSAEGWRTWLTNASLDRAVSYETTSGVPYVSRARDVLLQVFSHGQYHRGQIASLVAAAGGRPACTDYIFFTREQGD